MELPLLLGVIGIFATIFFGALGLAIRSKRKQKSFVKAGRDVKASGDIIVGGQVKVSKGEESRKEARVAIPRYKKDQYRKHGVIWEFEVYGPNIDNHGQPVPLCPKDQSELTEVSVVSHDDVYYGSVDETLGEQIMKCPDCQAEYRFPFEFYNDLLNDVTSSYRGKRRRERVK